LFAAYKTTSLYAAQGAYAQAVLLKERDAKKSSRFYQTIKAAVKKMRLRHDLRNAERMLGTARGPFPI
jgi:hypothetical protein